MVLLMCDSIVKAVSITAPMFLMVVDGRISDVPIDRVHSVTFAMSVEVPKMMNSVLESLSFRKFLSIHNLMSSTHASNLAIAEALSDGLNGRYSCISSA